MPTPNLQYTVALEAQRAIASARSLGTALQSLAKTARETRDSFQAMERTTSDGGRGVASMAAGLKNLLAPLAALAGGYYGLRFAVDQFSSSLHQAADMETMETSFTVLLHSGAAAKAMLADLTKFADTTPMRLTSLATATRTLLAFGDPAANVKKDLREIGDVAAGINAPIEDIAELFGKARTEGTLYSIDIREMSRRGIPIIAELAKQFGVNETAIHKMAETGRIKFANLEQAFRSLTGSGGIFYQMLARQSQTANGLLSTLEDAIAGVYREFGKPLLDPLKAAMTAGIAYISSLKDKAREWGAELSNAAKGAMAVFQNGDAGAALGAALRLGFAEAVGILYRGSVATIATLVAGLAAAAEVLIKALSKPAVWKLISDALDVAGYSLVAIIEKGLADVYRSIPGMAGAAKTMDAVANTSDTKGLLATRQAKLDLQNADVQDVASEARDKVAAVGGVFGKTYAGTQAPQAVQEMAAKAKADLAPIVQKANASNNPLPQYSDWAGNVYGPGAPYGSPDSQMPKPGTVPAAADLGAAIQAMLHGPAPVAPPDPGVGTINGVRADETFDPGDVTSPAPVTRKLSQPNIPSSNLNARAGAMVGGGSGDQRDPQIAVTNEILRHLLGAIAGLAPKPTVAGSGL